MADRLTRQSGTVFLLLALYLFLNVVVRLMLPASLELDEAEQFFYSQWLSFGYGPQPPLYNWMQMAVFAFTGRTVLGLTLLKHALLFSTYVFYWLAARRCLQDNRLQLVSVLALLTLPQVSFMPEQDLAHTVALLAATALFLYAFYRIIDFPDAAGYVWAGIAIGLGFLAKYNFPLLPVAALLAVLPERKFRNRIFHWRLLVTLAVAVAIVLPHLVWLSSHLDLATAETLGKMTDKDGRTPFVFGMLKGISSLAVAIVAFCAMTFAIFTMIYRRRSWRVLKAQSPTIRITERMICILLVALVLIILATGAVHIRERWLDPFLLILPLYLCMKIEAAGAQASVVRTALLAIPVMIMIAIPASLILRVTTASLSGRYTKINVPFDSFAEKLLANGKTTPALVVTEDRHLAGNMLAHLDAVPVLTTQFPEWTLPFAWEEKRPILLAWRSRSDSGMPAALQSWMKIHASSAAVVKIQTLELPYHYGRAGDVYHFSYAWLYPAGL